MKKLLTITAALVVMFAMTASATSLLHNAMYEVRSITMGGERINNIIKDQGNIWLYPQTVNMYADQAEGVWDDNLSNEFARLGVHFKFGDNNPFVLGIYVDQTGGAMFNPYLGYTWGRTPTAVSLPNNHVVNVFYGRNMGGKPFGLHLQAFNSKNEGLDPLTAIDGNASMSAFAVSAGLTNVAGNLDLAAGVFFSTFTDEIIGSTNTEPDGSFQFFVRGRRWSVQSSKVTWVWHGEAGFGKVGIKYGPVGSAVTEEWKHTMFNVGLGLNYTPTSKVLAVLDFGFEYAKADNVVINSGVTTTDATAKSFSIPPYYSLGVDAEVLSWLDLRMGASNTRSNITADAGGTDYKLNQNMIDTYVGFGFHWNNLTVDTYVNPNFITDGPNFVSGNTTDQIFMYAAATLHFGN